MNVSYHSYTDSIDLEILIKMNDFKGLNTIIRFHKNVAKNMTLELLFISIISTNLPIFMDSKEFVNLKHKLYFELYEKN